MNVSSSYINTPNKIAVLIVIGTNEMQMHPVPPIADSAPSWNIYRLTEAVENINIQVISPCEKNQVNRFKQFKISERYHLVIINPIVLVLHRKILRHLWWPFHAVLKKITKVHNVIDLWYLHHVFKKIQQIKPDIIFINDRPQYIQYFHKKLHPKPFYFFLRGEMGASRQYLHHVKGIVVNSNGIEEYARAIVREKPMRFWKMPNMLGNEFVPCPPPVNRFFRKNKKIIYSGRLIPEKGVLELIKAFEIVQKKVPNSELLLYGASDNYKFKGSETLYEKKLKQLSNSFPDGCIRFMGYINNQEMSKVYSNADLAVFPSICKESFGMVALEAMRSGTPVVASLRPGFIELIIEGETGCLVNDPTNINELASKILFVLQNPNEARLMGEAGYKRSLLFTPEIAANRFEKIIHEIMEDKIY